jgi:hypothetical protein
MNPFESPEPTEKEIEPIDLAECAFGIILFCTLFMIVLWFQLENTLSPAARGYNPTLLEREIDGQNTSTP